MFNNGRSWRILNTLGITLYSGAMSYASETFTLPKGQYIFVVDGSQSQAANFDFSLLHLTSKTGTISLDTDVVGSLDVLGQSAELDFHLDASTTLLFDSLVNNPDIRLTLVGPNGTVFSGWGLHSFETYSSRVNLNATGDYKLIVTSVNYRVADFAFRLHDLRVISSQGLPGTQTITLSPGKSSRIFAFNAQAGEHLSYRNTGLSAGLVTIYVVNEQGSMEILPFNAQYDFEAILPSSKKYYLVIEGALDNIEPVELGVDLHLAHDEAFSVNLDEEAKGHIESQSVTDTWNFTLDSQTRLFVDELNGSDVAWSIYNSSNQWIAGQDSLSTLQLLELESGNYSLVVRASPNGGSILNEYAFKLRNVSTAQELPVAGSYTNPEQTTFGAADTYKITVQVGQNVLLRALELNGQPGMVTVFNSTGEVVAGANLQGIPITLNSNAAPEEFIVVIDSDFNSPSHHSYELKTDVLVEAKKTAALGTRLDGLLAAFNYYDSYQIHLDSPVWMMLNGTASSANIRWQLKPVWESLGDWNHFSTDPLDNPTEVYQAGDYVLTLSSDAPTAVDYSVQLLKLEGAPDLPSGEIVQRLQNSKDGIAFSFDLNSFQELAIDPVLSNTNNLKWVVFGNLNNESSNGLQVVAQSDLPNGGLDVGHYTIVLFSGDEGAQSLALTTNILSMPPPSVEVNSEVNAVLDQSGNVAYRFELGEPTSLVLDALNDLAGLYWHIEDFQGNVVYSGVHGVAQSPRINLAAGGYRLKFLSPDYVINANAEISFKLANQDTAALPLDLSIQTNGALNAYGVLNYQFTVPTSTLAWLDSIGSIPGVDWQIQDNQGNSGYSGVFGVLQNMPINLAAGTYSLRFLSNDVFSNAYAAISFNLIDITGISLPITSGVPIQGILAADNNVAVYRFDGSNIDTFQFNTAGNNAPANNNSLATAQSIPRSAFGISPSVNVGNASLPRLEIRAAHNTANDVDFYAFHLVAGESLILDIDNTNMDTMLWIYDASGVQLAANDDSSSGLGGSGSTSNNNSYLEYTAPTSGTYYVAFTQYPQNPLTQTTEGAVTGAPYTLNVSISPVGSSTGFGVLPNVVNELAETASTLWYLYTQTGGLVASGDVNSNSIAYNLQDADQGLYYLMVDGGADPVNYDFSIKLVQNQPLVIDVVVDAVLDQYGEISYQFIVTEPTKLWLEALNDVPDLAWFIQETAAGNGNPNSGNFGAGLNGLIDLPSAGVYTLKYVVQNSFSNPNASISFKLANINPPVVSLVIDSTVNTTLNPYGLLSYRFELSEPASLVLDALNELAGLDWQIDDFQGNVVYSGVYGVAHSPRINLAAGVYTLRYLSPNYTLNANADISFKLAKQDSLALPLNLGVQTNGALNAYGVLNYQVTVTTPTLVWLDTTGSIPGVDWQIQDNQGHTVYSGVFGVLENAPISLAVGTYSLKYLSREVFSNADTTISFNLTDITGASLPIASGVPVQGIMDATNNRAVYRFDGSQINTFQLITESNPPANNNTLANAQDIPRSAFGILPSVNVGNASLPRVEINAAHNKTNDVDFYAFHLVAGERLILDIDNTNMDTMLWVYDGNGSQLAVNDDNSAGLGGGGSTSGANSYLEYTAPTSANLLCSVYPDPQTRSPKQLKGL